jgi:hypothetical protein
LFQAEKYAGNQKSAQDKKKVDSHPEQGNAKSVRPKNHQDRNRTKPVDLRDAPRFCHAERKYMRSSNRSRAQAQGRYLMHYLH